MRETPGMPLNDKEPTSRIPTLIANGAHARVELSDDEMRMMRMHPPPFQYPTYPIGHQNQGQDQVPHMQRGTWGPFIHLNRDIYLPDMTRP